MMRFFVASRLDSYSLSFWGYSLGLKSKKISGKWILKRYRSVGAIRRYFDEPQIHWITDYKVYFFGYGACVLKVPKITPPWRPLYVCCVYIPDWGFNRKWSIKLSVKETKWTGKGARTYIIVSGLKSHRDVWETAPVTDEIDNTVSLGNPRVPIWESHMA